MGLSVIICDESFIFSWVAVIIWEVYVIIWGVDEIIWDRSVIILYRQVIIWGKMLSSGTELL